MAPIHKMIGFLSRYVAKASLMKAMNLWPPLLGAGIRVTRVDSDFRQIDVTLGLRPWTRNYVGTQYGGSLYSMCDPFYMLMLMENLGGDYIVWDKAATIDFKKPGTTPVRASFTLTEQTLEEVRNKTATGEKYLPKFLVEVRDESGDIICEIEKTLYIRRKDAVQNRSA